MARMRHRRTARCLFLRVRSYRYLRRPQIFRPLNVLLLMLLLRCHRAAPSICDPPNVSYPVELADGDCTNVLEGGTCGYVCLGAYVAPNQFGTNYITCLKAEWGGGSLWESDECSLVQCDRQDNSEDVNVYEEVFARGKSARTQNCSVFSESDCVSEYNGTHRLSWQKIVGEEALSNASASCAPSGCAREDCCTLRTTVETCGLSFANESMCMGPSYTSCSCATAGSGNFLRQCPGGESCAKGDCCTSDLCPGIGHSIDWVSLGRRFATCQGEAHFLGYVFVSVVQSCAYLATEDARCDAGNAVTLFQDGRCYCCAQPQTDVGPSSQILEFFADMFILTRRDVCILNDVVATPKTNASPGNCSGLDRLSEDEFCVPVCDEGYDLSAPTSCEPGITPSLRVGRCFEDFDLGVEGYVAAVESDDNSSSSDSGGGHSDDVATIVYEMNISSWPLCKGYGAAGKCAQVAVERAAVDISLQTLSTTTGIPNDARLNVSFVGFGATSTASTATRLPRLCTNEESGCASYVDGDVRMTSGTNENLSLPLGLLEMYTDGAFRPVCGHLFVDDDNGADAACRSLGYPDGGRVVILQDDTLYASYRQASEGSVHVGKCGATDRIDNCTELCCVDGITLDFGYDRPTSNPSHACSNRYDVGCGSCYPRLDDFAYICNTPSNHCA